MRALLLAVLGVVLVLGTWYMIHKDDGVASDSEKLVNEREKRLQAPQLIAAGDTVAAPITQQPVESAAESAPGATLTEPAKLVSPVTPTMRSDALKLAKEGSGRLDPFAPVKALSSPAEGESEVAEAKEGRANIKGKFKVPPPPPGFVAPPPPMPEDSLNFSELPQPPSRVQIGQKMELTGILGDRAIFAITDPAFIRQSGVARTVSLAPGEKFESVTVQSVGADSVVLEEDGEKTVRSLPLIR